MKVKCKYCGSGNTVKKGLRKNKFEEIQKYYCKDCGGYFVLKDIADKTYPAKVIMKVISLYNQGLKQKEIVKRINRNRKLGVNQSTISSWLNEYKEVCSYHRIRDKVKRLYTDKKVILKKVFHHQQPYKYLMHRGKADLFINEYFLPLKDYLVAIREKCPNELFNSDDIIRCSQLQIDYKARVEAKKSHACKLAKLALAAVKDNRKRHSVLQEFMLYNDSVTVACEVPVWLSVEEAMKFEVFRKIGVERAITGHIDLLQMKFGKVFVLDYKPGAAKEKHAWCQVFAYALALSVRTGVWLRNFRCAWFDDSGYYEFDPSSVVLAFDAYMPSWRKKEFVFDPKAGLFFTSKYFQKIKGSGRKIKRRGYERYFGKLGYKGDVK